MDPYGLEEEDMPGGPRVPPGKTTLGALRGSGHRYHSVPTEIREHLVAQTSSRRSSVPDVVGFDETVLPELERALFALHDVLVIGDRGQGRSTLLRGLEQLLDVWLPIIEGSELHEHPMHPQTPWARQMVAEHGDDTPVDWVKRDVRIGELRATADTTVTDLLGDDHPEHGTGLIPAMNRGVVILDDLGSLPPRVQAALAATMSDRSLRIGHGSQRLELDVVIVAVMDRVDYHEYGRLIPALRDRFGGVVATHYPPSLAHEVEILRHRTRVGPKDSNLFIPQLPPHLIEIIARFARAIRHSSSFDPEASASVRLGMDMVEHLGGSSARRSSQHHEPAITRPSDLATLIPAIADRIHVPDADPVAEVAELQALLTAAIGQVCRTKLAEVEVDIISARFAEGLTVTTGPQVASAKLLEQLGTIPRFATLLKQFGIRDGAETPGLAAGAVELVLEGLAADHQLQRDRDGLTTSYRATSSVPTG